MAAFNIEDKTRRIMTCSPLTPSSMMDIGAPKIPKVHTRKDNQCEGGGERAKPKNCDKLACGHAAINNP